MKVIEPLSKAIAAKRGTPHRPECCAARKSDELASCDENETLCALRTDRILARASLYSFVIYCNLFHADIEESYGQLPLNVGLLGSELRHWMQGRIYKYEWYVHFLPSSYYVINFKTLTGTQWTLCQSHYSGFCLDEGKLTAKHS